MQYGKPRHIKRIMYIHVVLKQT